MLFYRSEGKWEMLIILKDLKMPKTTFLEIFKIIFKVKMCILLFNANGSQNEIGLHNQLYFSFHTTNDIIYSPSSSSKTELVFSYQRLLVTNCRR